jgi:hypothetical protein
LDTETFRARTASFDAVVRKNNYGGKRLIWLNF